MDTVLRVWPHEGWAEGEDHLLDLLATSSVEEYCRFHSVSWQLDYEVKYNVADQQHHSKLIRVSETSLSQDPSMFTL